MPLEVFLANFRSLEKIRDFFAQAARAAGLDEDAVYDVQMAADEAAANIIDHAYGGEDLGVIECSYEFIENGIRIVLHDHGKAFDPDLISPPDVSSDPCSRKPRGLGLYFMQKLMDNVSFTFNGDGGNILTMEKIKENCC
ncbi:MAG: ATP-binding protein [Anaerolineaceae bacterium]